MAKRRNRGEGSVFQRPDGTWRAQICHRRQRLSFSADTRNECIVWIQGIQTEVHKGWNLHGAKTLVTDYAAYWIEMIGPKVRPKTLGGYQSVLNNHVLPALGVLPLKDLTLERIDQFYAELLDMGVGRHTISYCHRTLHVMLEKAVKYNFIFRNPAHGATVPQVPTSEMSVLDEEQVNRFLSAAMGTRYEALFHLAVTTGMRQAELFGLKWADISWQRGLLYLRRQAYRVKDQGVVFSEPKTRAGRRTIKLSENTLQKLREHKARQAIERDLAGKRWQEYDLVFTSKLGSAMDQSNLRKEFYAILELAGLPKMRFHDLRHTAASLMLNNGIPVIVVSKILGHSKPSVTLDIYGHLFNEMQDEAARLMDSLTESVAVPVKLVGNEKRYAPLIHQICTKEPAVVLKISPIGGQ